MLCPACGERLTEADGRCPHCGADALEAIGDPIDEDARKGNGESVDDEQPVDVTGESVGDEEAADHVAFGLNRRLASGFSYSLTFVSGLAIYVLVDDEHVRFHAARSLVVFGGLFGFSFLATALQGVAALALGDGAAVVLGVLSNASILLAFALWLVLLIAAFREWPVPLPVVDGVVERFAAGRA